MPSHEPRQHKPRAAISVGEGQMPHGTNRRLVDIRISVNGNTVDVMGSLAGVTGRMMECTGRTLRMDWPTLMYCYCIARLASVHGPA